MDTTKRQARVAGVLYLLLAIVGPVGIVVVPGRVFVPGDAAATAAAIAASQNLLRIGIVSELIAQVIQIFVALALYRLFKPVSDMLAKQLLLLAVVSVPISFVNTFSEIAALLSVGGTLSPAFAQPQLDALAYFFMTLHSQGLVVIEVFWGLWLLPFALLVIRSGFIPKIFGYLLAVAGFSYLVGSFATLLLPELAAQVRAVTGILVIAEVPVVVWLVIWGTRTPKPAAR